MAIKHKPARKISRPLIWIISLSGLLTIITLLTYLLWPLITYNWSAGATRIYKFKGVTTGYDYTVSQKPANIIAGKKVAFVISIRKGTSSVSGHKLYVDTSRPCAYGWQTCDVNYAYITSSEVGTAEFVSHISGSSKTRRETYYLDIFTQSSSGSNGIGPIEENLVLSPVYPAWVGWIIGN